MRISPPLSSLSMTSLPAWPLSNNTYHNSCCGPIIPSPRHYGIIEEQQLFTEPPCSSLPVTERPSPVNGRSWVRAGVVAGTDPSPVQFDGNMVLVTLIQEDSAVFICGNLGASNPDISRTHSHPHIRHQKAARKLSEEFLLQLIFFLMAK